MAGGAAVDLIGVDRAGIREATQAGHLVVADAAGRLVAQLGDPDRRTFLRSCAKPFQALAGLRAGVASRLDLTGEEIAITCASHGGEPRHVELARAVLRKAEVPETALQCGAHWPADPAAARAARRAMEEPLAVFNNCSGKHAGMLAAAHLQGAPLGAYLEPSHPVQAGVRAAIEEFTGFPPSAIVYGIDGCSAPNAALPLRGAARAFAALVSTKDPNATLIVEAMCGHPFVIDGTDQLDTRIMEVSGGRILAKGGAAGLHCTADRRSGRGLAIKLESGDGTWMGVAVVAALQRLGWLDATEAGALAEFATPTVRNHRRLAVGEAYPLPGLQL